MMDHRRSKNPAHALLSLKWLHRLKKWNAVHCHARMNQCGPLQLRLGRRSFHSSSFLFSSPPFLFSLTLSASLSHLYLLRFTALGRRTALCINSHGARLHILWKPRLWKRNAFRYFSHLKKFILLWLIEMLVYKQRPCLPLFWCTWASSV